MHEITLEDFDGFEVRALMACLSGFAEGESKRLVFRCNPYEGTYRYDVILEKNKTKSCVECQSLTEAIDAYNKIEV